MPTVVVSAENTDAYASGLAAAAAALRDGRLVVFPTETVYGIAACATRPDALKRLRAAKGIDEQRPFTVHLAQRQDASDYLRQPSPLVRRLARRAWPGPLTLLAEETDPAQAPIARKCPADLLASIYREHLIGLRCPDHPAATRLLAEANVPVVATSANQHGQPSPTTCPAPWPLCPIRPPMQSTAAEHATTRPQLS